MICRRIVKVFFNYRFDQLQTITSALDESISSQSFTKIKPYLLPAKSFLTSFALHSRGSGIDFLHLAKNIIEAIETDKSQEYLIQPVWVTPSDWNKYFEQLKSMSFSHSKVFWSCKKSSSFVPCFHSRTLDYTIAHSPYFLSEKQEKKGFFVDQYPDLALKDLSLFLALRHNELKMKGQLVLFSDLKHENSPNQLLKIAQKLFESNGGFNDIEKSKIILNAEDLDQAEIESVLGEFKDRFRVVHQEVLTNEILSEEKQQPDTSLFTNYVKEKIGFHLYKSMKSSRIIAEKEKQMSAFFSMLKDEIDQASPEIKQKTLVCLLEKTHK